MHHRRLAASLLALLASACGASASDAPSDPPAPPPAVASPQEPDASACCTVPSALPNLPRVVSLGGPILRAPKIVPVFFGADPLRPDVERFLRELAASAYWSATTSEYGVGAPTIAPAIVGVDAPTTDEALRAWLATQAADDGTVFAVFLPDGASIDVHGKRSCSAFDGYHLGGTTSSGTPFAYAVNARCASGEATLDAVTVSMSHELVEAATDPFYETNPAYAAADDAHGVWTFVTVGETADMCELEPNANARLVGAFMVQRSWSNAAAKLGHDPCVPAPPGPFFTAVPTLEEDTAIDTGRGSIRTKGVRIAVGQTKTIDVALLGDAPTGSFRVSAKDTSALYGGPKELELSFDRAEGAAGDVLKLTIRALKAGRFGGSVLVLTSTQGDRKHVSLGFVANGS